MTQNIFYPDSVAVSKPSIHVSNLSHGYKQVIQVDRNKGTLDKNMAHLLKLCEDI